MTVSGTALVTGVSPGPPGDARTSGGRRQYGDEERVALLERRRDHIRGKIAYYRSVRR